MEKRARGPVPLAEAIQAFLREAGIGSRGSDAAVFNAWRQAYGGDDARPVTFRNRDLVVEVATPALLQDLKSFHGDRLRRKANQILGEDRIRRVLVKLKG